MIELLISGDLFNDVAILKLSEPSSATPVELNRDINYPSEISTPLKVIGFGATAEGGSPSSILQELSTFYETIETCQTNYPDVEHGTHICGDVDNKGDCQGDSGGPLFDLNHTQIGIVSYGKSLSETVLMKLYPCCRSLKSTLILNTM